MSQQEPAAIASPVQDENPNTNTPVSIFRCEFSIDNEMTLKCARKKNFPFG